MKSYAIQQKCSNELGESQPNLQQAQFQKKFGRRTHCANIQDIIMRCRNIKRKWQRTCVGRRRIVNFFIDSQVSLSGICGSIRICYCQQNRVITRNLETKKNCNYFNKPGQVFTCTDKVNLRSKMWAEKNLRGKKESKGLHLKFATKTLVVKGENGHSLSKMQINAPTCFLLVCYQEITILNPLSRIIVIHRQSPIFSLVT